MGGNVSKYHNECDPVVQVIDRIHKRIDELERLLTADP